MSGLAKTVPNSHIARNELRIFSARADLMLAVGSYVRESGDSAAMDLWKDFTSKHKSTFEKVTKDLVKVNAAENAIRDKLKLHREICRQLREVESKIQQRDARSSLIKAFSGSESLIREKAQLEEDKARNLEDIVYLQAEIKKLLEGIVQLRMNLDMETQSKVRTIECLISKSFTNIIGPLSSTSIIEHSPEKE